MPATSVALPLLLAALPAGTPAQASDQYILGAGDALDLQLHDARSYSGYLDVLSDGTAALPLVGTVMLEGLTLPQATSYLTQLYGRQLRRPELTLRLVRPRPVRVSLVGEVTTPGLYSMAPGNSASSADASRTVGTAAFGPATLVDAIQKAGGVTVNANLRDVAVRRRLPGRGDSYKMARFDLLSLVRDGDQINNPLLFDGDIVRVGRVAQPDAVATEVAANNLSPRQIRVNVMGEVNNPGRQELPAGTPLVQALLAAGGPRDMRADQGSVQLVRLNRNGSVTRQSFRLSLDEPVSSQANPPLRDGDTIVVNRSALGRATDAVGGAMRTLGGLVNGLTLFQLLR